MAICDFFVEQGLRVLKNEIEPVSGKNIVCFVHGMWGGAQQFIPWMLNLERRGIAACAIDLQGHGRSRGFVENVSIDAYADDVREVLKRLARTGSPIILVGHSMGGLIVQRTLTRWPSIAQKVVLLASAPAAGIFLRGQILWRMLRPRYLRAMWTCEGFLPTQEDANALMLNRHSPEEQQDRANWRSYESGLAAREMALWAIKADPLPCPSLVIGAEYDVILPPSVQKAIAKKHRSQYAEILGADHYLMTVPALENQVLDLITSEF